MCEESSKKVVEVVATIRKESTFGEFRVIVDTVKDRKGVWVSRWMHNPNGSMVYTNHKPDKGWYTISQLTNADLKDLRELLNTVEL